MVAEASASAVVAGYGIQRQPERQAATDPPCSGGWPRDMMARRGNERGTIMGMYLTKFSHTHETWARLLANPEDRRAVLGPVVEAAGGKLHGYWYAFGDADGFVLIEARRCHGRGPPRQGGLHGAFTNVSTTKLLTVEEALDALRRSGGMDYRAPGAPGT
jgi:GYD domain